jgi:hypothetical protein
LALAGIFEGMNMLTLEEIDKLWASSKRRMNLVTGKFLPDEPGEYEFRQASRRWLQREMNEDPADAPRREYLAAILKSIDCWNQQIPAGSSSQAELPVSRIPLSSLDQNVSGLNPPQSPLPLVAASHTSPQPESQPQESLNLSP